MNIEEIFRMIANFGFSIAVAVYPLVVFGAKMDRLTDALEKLTRYIEGLSKKRERYHTLSCTIRERKQKQMILMLTAPLLSKLS